MERVLKTMIARCEDGNLPDCPLIEALFRESDRTAAKKTLEQQTPGVGAA